ncbi:hypothetical protein GQ43DRAFT_472734 [Delitschia confertaspora ATCC 74209]|uniref:Vezatin n=1 Tax=Delitschia confertaspora ATCC 74209 TaxID=1513339 RepID=A0A9P4JPV4_9PLEO|nr:hypothetical protein GQ43DRAFT_472734 [Delitschia confertaspora ATCC 74209]
MDCIKQLMLIVAIGEGRGSVPPSSADTSPTASPKLSSFAPRGPSNLQAKIRENLPKPLRVQAGQHGSFARIHTVLSRAVNTRIARADNQRFLEHFRYLIVASQLLAEHTGQTGVRPAALYESGPNGQGPAQDFKVTTINITGAVVTGGAAFVLVWLLHWSRSRGFSKGRFLIVVLLFALLATTGYAYVRRQWLQYLRQQAVQTASILITNLQAFDVSTSAALALIQEVELVARGYRLSSGPLPPVSRLEEKGQARRCQRLRKSVRAAYAETMPILVKQCAALKQLVQEDDLEKYLDVYDISNPDLQEARQGYSETEFEDAETLRAQRTLQYRVAILRRVYMCSLLALEADGGKPDFARWTVALESMISVAGPMGEWCEKINRILGEEELVIPPSPPKIPSTPGREKLRASVRKLNDLSQGIRGLQAKMQILREETTHSLEESEDVTELGTHLMAQYESIGADIKSLVQAWESGKTALALNIDRQERRISQASSGLRSPAPSLGGLTAVDEGGPSDALRALNGENLSPGQSGPPSVTGSNSDEEVFEAIAIPRTRPIVSKEERLRKVQEDRERQAAFREQREANTNMLRELESVIHLRPLRGLGANGGRVTSI